MKHKLMIAVLAITSFVILFFVAFNNLPGRAIAATTDTTSSVVAPKATTDATTSANDSTTTTQKTTPQQPTGNAPNVTPAQTSNAPNSTLSTTSNASSSTSTTVSSVASSTTGTDPTTKVEVPMLGNTASEAIINQGNIKPDDITLNWESYQVGFLWLIPDGFRINDGDTAEFTIPDNLRVNRNLTFAVKDPDGIVIGTFSIKAGEQTGILTFNDALSNTTTGRKGTLSFMVKGTTQTDDGNGFVINKFGWVNTPTMPTTSTDSDSTDQNNEGNVPNSLTWNVAFNSTGQTLTNVKVIDTIGDGQEYVPGSLRAYYGYSLNGQFVNQGSIEPDSVAQMGNELVVTFDKVDSYIDMYYDVSITNIDANGFNEWHNRVTIQSDEISGQAQHTIGWGGSGTGKGDSGSVILSKIDSETGKPIVGATFQLLDESGNVVQDNLTTNENGEIEASELQPGNYVLVETGVPDGYQQSTSNKWPFTIVDGDKDPVEITAENTPYTEIPNTGDVVIYKLDSQSHVSIPGAVFKLLDESGNVVSLGLVTNEQGAIELSGIPAGKYSLIETTAPEGYELNSTPVEFVVTAGTSDEPVSVDVYDTKTPPVLPTTGSVDILKIDSDTQAPLADAIFEIKDDQGNIVQTNLKTNNQGKIEVANLAAGKYELIEITPPDGYSTQSGPVSFEITAGKVTSVSVTDKKNTQIIPVPPEPGNPEPENPEPPVPPIEPIIPPEPSNPEPPIVEPVTPEPNPEAPEAPDVSEVVKPGGQTSANKLPQTGNTHEQLLISILGILFVILIVGKTIFKREN